MALAGRKCSVMDTDGFETWENTKAGKTKRLGGKKKDTEYEEVVMTKKGGPAATSGSCTRSGKKKKGPRRDESNAAVVRIEKGDGIVVITEEEYVRLQEMKKKQGAPSRGGNDYASIARGENGSVRDERPSKSEGNISRPSSSKRVAEDAMERRKLENGKHSTIQVPSASKINLRIEEDVLNTEINSVEGVMRPEEDCSSDSDFQCTPEGGNDGGSDSRVSRGKVRQTLFSKNGGRGLPNSDEHRPQHARLQVGRQRDTCNSVRHTAATAKLGQSVSRVAMKRPSTSSSLRLQVASKAVAFYPFEDSISKEDFSASEKRRGTRSAEYCTTDDDFEEPLHGSLRRSRMTETPSRRTESELRANRKRKRVEREADVQKRQAAGEKPYYIMVSGTGTPYGDGVSAWKAELNKLCRALDPSIRDVRQQPHQQLQILKKRLTDNFEYSDRISDKYLIPLIGHQVSARRNFLMNKIKEDKPPPPGCNLEAWNRLTDIWKSPNFVRKSAAMTYANSCRQNYGRTGPGGEIAVRESLKTKYGRSPDPEEVQAEMVRDKDYGGKKKKRREFREGNESVSCDIEEDEHENKPHSMEDLHVDRVRSAAEIDAVNTRSCRGMEAPMQGIEILQKILVEMEALKARVDGLACTAAPSHAEAAGSRLPGTSPESSSRRTEKE